VADLKKQQSGNGWQLSHRTTIKSYGE